jgi:hypothetical protein
MEKLSRSVRRAKQVKKKDADWAGRTADVAGRTADVAGRTVTWQDRTGHVAAPGRDTCHAFLAFSTCLTNWK